MLTREQVEALHKPLKRGDKKKLALFLNMPPQHLARHINYKNHKCFQGFKMPLNIYEQIKIFINQQKM